MNITIPKIHVKAPALPKRTELMKGLALIALSRARLPYMAPTGLAFAATFSPENAYIALIGIATGMADAPLSALKYILSFFVYYILIHIKKTDSKKTNALLLALSVPTAGVIGFLWSGASLLSALMLIPEAAACGALYYLFTFTGDKSPASHFADAIILGSILCGTSEIIIPYININAAVFAAIFICLSLCYSCELSVAVTASAVIGFVMSIADEDAVMLCGGFVICAVLSSILSGMGKFAAAVGFLCGITVTVLYRGSLTGINPADIFIPIAFFAVLPDSVHYKIGAFINSRFEAEYEEAEVNSRIASQLRTVARAVCDLGEGVTLASGLKDSDTMELMDIVAARVCHDCSLCGNCWKKDSKKTYENMYEIWRTMEQDGFCDHSNMPLSFKQVCLRSESFLCEFKHVYELAKQSALLTGEAGTGRNIMAKQYGEISNVINLLSEEIEAGYTAREAAPARYCLEITAASEPKPGQSVCGDTLIHFKRDNKYFVILCDGMGSGASAMSQSRLAARLFEEFLKAGFEKRTAVDMINSALALKADQESFSTADILEINLETCVAEFLKIGSAQSFLKTKSNIEVISSKALPIGILENIDAEPECRELKAGDMILMISDGVGEAGAGVLKNEWIKKLLMLENRNDKELAKLILTSAKSRTRFCDDMTCCVIKIKKNRE